MSSFLGFGIGAGLGVGAWRQLPPVSQRAGGILVVVVLGAIGLAWLGGRRHGQRQEQSQWQVQVQEQEQAQAQEQGQQQAVIVNVLSEGAAVAATAAPLAHQDALSGATSSQDALSADVSLDRAAGTLSDALVANLVESGPSGQARRQPGHSCPQAPPPSSAVKAVSPAEPDATVGSSLEGRGGGATPPRT